MAKYKLEDICEFITDGTHQTPEYCDENGVIFLSSKDVTERRIDWDNVKHIPMALHEQLYKRLKPQKNDILLAKNGTTGVAAIVDRDEVFDVYVSLAVLRPKPDIYPKYLLYAINSPVAKRQFNAGLKGIGVPNLHLSVIRKTELNIEERGKQESICLLLDKISGLIALRQQQLEYLDDLIKARFVEMFGDINVNDRNWDCQPLGELCTIVRGGSPRPIENFLGGDVPWIKIGDATDGESIYLNSTKEHIIQEGVKKSRLVKAGSLIFANCGVSLGFARIITFDGCIHDGWLAMEDIDERLDKVFLLQALNQMTEHFRAIAPAGTQPNLNTAIMKAYKQIIPTMELQKDYIMFCKQVDKSKVAVQKSLDESQKLFDSLMQEYFG